MNSNQNGHRPPSFASGSEAASETKAPVIPGGITVCGLTFGPHVKLCGRFLESLYAKTDAEEFKLRLGLNAVCEEMRGMAGEYEARYRNIRLVESPVNLFKNPMMRRMFNEPPITTEWTAWFDDDSYVLRADWLARLAIKIELHPQIDVWGVRYILFPNDDALRFARTSPSYRGKPWETRVNETGDEVPCFDFPTGGFWVARTRVLQALDWPDPRLQLAGEDFFFGEALRQNGYQVGSFERCIAVSAAERRNPSAKEVAEIPLV
jgi:GT2 family glycosyltransferase